MSCPSTKEASADSVASGGRSQKESRRPPSFCFWLYFALSQHFGLPGAFRTKLLNTVWNYGADVLGLLGERSWTAQQSVMPEGYSSGRRRDDPSHYPCDDHKADADNFGMAAAPHGLKKHPLEAEICTPPGTDRGGPEGPERGLLKPSPLLITLFVPFNFDAIDRPVRANLTVRDSISARDVILTWPLMWIS